MPWVPFRMSFDRDPIAFAEAAHRHSVRTDSTFEGHDAFCDSAIALRGGKP